MIDDPCDDPCDDWPDGSPDDVSDMWWLLPEEWRRRYLEERAKALAKFEALPKTGTIRFRRPQVFGVSAITTPEYVEEQRRKTAEMRQQLDEAREKG